MTLTIISAAANTSPGPSTIEGSGIAIVRITGIDATASSGLDGDGMTVLDEFADAFRRHADTILVDLGFLGNADVHKSLLRDR